MGGLTIGAGSVGVLRKAGMNVKEAEACASIAIDNGGAETSGQHDALNMLG